MKYNEFGDRMNPTIILLHGEGLSRRSFTDLIHLLEKEYHIVTPVIDGHGEDKESVFISIQDSAQKLIQYIDENHEGKVLAVWGISLGAQIALDVLSRRADIAEYAVIESALAVPPSGVTRLMVESESLLYGFIRQKWFAGMQARALVGYTAPDALKNTKAKVIIIIGSKEIRTMDKSVRKLMSMLPQSQVCVVPGMKNGEAALSAAQNIRF